MQIPSMPFKILVLASLRPFEQTPWPDDPIQIEKTNVDQRMEELGLSLEIPLSQHLFPSGRLTIPLKRFKDFHPDQLVEKNPPLKNLLEARAFAEGARGQGLSEGQIHRRLREWPNLPAEIRVEPPPAKAPPSGSSSRSIDQILEKVALPGGHPDASGQPRSFTDQINGFLRQTLEQVFSNEPFRHLESVWQGVRCLLQQGNMDGASRLEIIPVSSETLEETLSQWMPKLVEDLPSLIVVDLPFDNSPRSSEQLEKIAQFSETLLVPALCWITQKFLFLDSWQDLPRLPFLPHYLDGAPFAKWRQFKGMSSARWLALTCNRFLVRYPFGPDNPPRLIRFEEPGLPWVSPVWAIAGLISQSFLKTGWPTRFTQWQEMKLEGLGLHKMEGNQNIPTEVNFSDERIDQLIRGGILPLVSSVNKDTAFAPMETTAAGGSLTYQLFLSRMTQFLLWCKDNLEKESDPGLLEQTLTKAFSLFWERSGHPAPKGLAISASNPGPGKPTVVKILVEPPRQIVPSGEKVELELVW